MSSSYAFTEHKAIPHKETYQQEKTLPQQQSCPASSCEITFTDAKAIQALQEESLKKISELQQNEELQILKKEILRKENNVLEDKMFQQFVVELHEKLPNSLPTCQSTTKMPAANAQIHNPQGNIYIFVSFSLGEKALMNLAYEAKRFGARLVLRGFKACPREGGKPGKISYAKTVQALQKIILKTGQGVSIDPELFTIFSVFSVPTYVLAKPIQLDHSKRTQTPLHDRMQGHVSIHYALEAFAKEGVLHSEAKALLVTAGSNPLREKGRAK